MAYVVTSSCVGTTSQECVEDKAFPCVEACPVDGIFGTSGDPQLYADPNECIDCGACYAACPFDAVKVDYDLLAAIS